MENSSQIITMKLHLYRIQKRGFLKTREICSLVSICKSMVTSQSSHVIFVSVNLLYLKKYTKMYLLRWLWTWPELTFSEFLNKRKNPLYWRGGGAITQLVLDVQLCLCQKLEYPVVALGFGNFSEKPHPKLLFAETTFFRWRKPQQRWLALFREFKKECFCWTL